MARYLLEAGLTGMSPCVNSAMCMWVSFRVGAGFSRTPCTLSVGDRQFGSEQRRKRSEAPLNVASQGSAVGF